jgi:hypothetical protein
MPHLYNSFLKVCGSGQEQLLRCSHDMLMPRSCCGLSSMFAKLPYMQELVLSLAHPAPHAPFLAHLLGQPSSSSHPASGPQLGLITQDQLPPTQQPPSSSNGSAESTATQEEAAAFLEQARSSAAPPPEAARATQGAAAVETSQGILDMLDDMD